MTEIQYPELDLFLLGFVAACSLVASLFFLRFWRMRRHILYLSLAVFFLVQSGSNAFVLTLSHPNEGSAAVFVLRLMTLLLVLGSLLWKSPGKRKAPA